MILPRHDIGKSETINRAWAAFQAGLIGMKRENVMFIAGLVSETKVKD
jgi:hypothetical protein